MKQKAMICCLAIILLFIANCIVNAASVQAENEVLEKRSFFAMNTYITMQISSVHETAILEKAEALIHQLESQFSVTDPKSELYAANHNNGHSITISSDVEDLLTFALKMAEKTNGALDPTIYPILTAWGFTTEKHQIPSQAEIESLLPLVDYKQLNVSHGQLTIPQDAAIDLGAIVKGYAGDQVAKFLRENGVNSALINLGGNIQTVGRKTNEALWKIGIRDPFSEQNLGVLAVEDSAVVTSGGYQNYFAGKDGESYWHILDPKTGYPVQNGLASVTVIASEGKMCDALSTAFFVMGLENTLDYWWANDEFELVLITEDRHVYITAGLKDVFSLNESAGNFALEVVTK